uniref:DNA mismatch repair proteins mutS family domain-containing protein n=1 Tax=Acrobeloides nanus TaxID=290746 RepID=A0A914CRA4_9BILA
MKRPRKADDETLNVEGFQQNVSINTSKSGMPKYKIKINTLNTRTPKNTTGSTNSVTIVALMEGRGTDRGQIGIASMDLRHSELSICEFYDTNAYTLLKVRLHILDPVEIILPEYPTEKNNPTKLLVDMIQTMFTNVTVVPLQRRYFNDARGIELIKQLAAPGCSNFETSMIKKYYCMASAAALIKYIEYIQNVLFAQNSLKVTYESVEDSCLIDVSTWKNLDLILLNKRHVKGEYNSLFEILNLCQTPGGMRTLRSCLLSPSANVDTINARLDAIEELVKNQSMLERLRSLMTNLHDLQQILTLCVHITPLEISNNEETKKSIRSKILQVIQLKALLSVVGSLSSVIEYTKCPILQDNRKRLEDERLREAADFINDQIDDAVLLKKQRGSVGAKYSVIFAVREGRHVLLDLSRRAYQELIVHLTQVAASEIAQIPGAQLNYSFSRGYHLTLNAAEPYSVNLPSQCMHIVRNRASVTFTTRSLIKYNDRLIQAETEVLMKSNHVVVQLIESIRKFLPALYNAVEYISFLDFITSLAVYSATVPTVRPIFSTQMVIKQGRHPILDYKHDVIPNDTYVVSDARFLIITGPNMAGKSTYMKQVCLLQILAQIGCKVPADFAMFVPMRQIFSRVGHNDDLSRNLSAFALEMSEMSVILQNITEHSFIIIDELARSTSTEEGMGICYAICESLIKSKAFVFFATHFLDISLLELNFSAVQNFHFAIETRKDEDGSEVLVPSHVLYKGMYRGPLYGLELAELTTLPETILLNAREMATRLRAAVETQHSKVDDPEMERRRLAHLAHRIIHLFSLTDTTSKQSLAQYLKHLRDGTKEGIF